MAGQPLASSSTAPRPEAAERAVADDTLEGKGRAVKPYRAIGLLLAALTFGLTLNTDIDGPLDLYHEGERLAHYDALKRGALPYRDFFVPHGLGEDVVKPYLACRLLGESVESVRRAGRNAYVYQGLLPALGAAGLIVAGATLFRANWAIALVAGLTAVSLYEVSERPLFAYLGLASLACHLHGRRRAWLVLAGALIGLAMLYSIETGIYAAAAALVWLALDPRTPRRRWYEIPSPARTHVRFLLLGMGLVIAPALLACLGAGVFRDVAENLRIQVLNRGEVWRSTYPVPKWAAEASLLENLHFNGGLLMLFYAIPLLFAVGAVVSIRARSGSDPERRSALLLTSLFGSMFWSSVVSRADIWHLAYASGPFFLFVGAWLTALTEMPRAKRLTFCAAGIAPLLACAALIDFGEGGSVGRMLGRESRLLPSHLRKGDEPLIASSMPRVGRVRIPPRQEGELRAIVDYIHAYSDPDDFLLDLSDQGLVYFLAERRCPSRFHFLSHCNTPELRKKMIDEVRAQPRLPRLVILPGGSELADDAVRRFVVERYEPAARIGGVELWRPRDAAPGAAAVDFHPPPP